MPDMKTPAGTRLPAQDRRSTRAVAAGAGSGTVDRGASAAARAAVAPDPA